MGKLVCFDFSLKQHFKYIRPMRELSASKKKRKEEPFAWLLLLQNSDLSLLLILAILLLLRLLVLLLLVLLLLILLLLILLLLRLLILTVLDVLLILIVLIVLIILHDFFSFVILGITLSVCLDGQPNMHRGKNSQKMACASHTALAFFLNSW